jgi:hypothetical protein
MNESEREWTQSVFQQAMEIVAVCGLLDMEAPEGSKQKSRAKRASVKALALADDAANRLNRANVAAEAQEVAAGGYNLTALATAPPPNVKE